MLDVIPIFNPEWTARSNSDPGITIIELLAFVLDSFHHTLDMIHRDCRFKESFSREAVISFMELIAYLPSSASPASADVTYVLSQAQDSDVTIPEGAELQTIGTNVKYFENDAELTISGPDFTDTTNATGTTTTIKVADSSLYSIGDKIEIDNDLVLRTITDIPDATTVEFLNNALSVSSTSGLKVRSYDSSVSTIPISVTGTATEGQTLSDTNAYTGDGSKLQEVLVGLNPVIDDTLKVYVDEGSGNILWTKATNNRLLNHDANERVYEISKDNEDRVTVRFGDGVNGLKLASGWVVSFTARVGGGETGNVNENTIVQLNTVVSVTGTLSVTNSDKASGGSNRETISNMKKSGPANLTSLVGNIVSKNDFNTAAQNISGVEKAQSILKGFNTICVYIVPTGASGSVPSSGLLSTVESTLNADNKRLITTQVRALPPSYVTIDITAKIYLNDNVQQSQIKSTIQSQIEDFFDASNVDFGITTDPKTYIHISDFYYKIENIVGVHYLEIEKFCRRPILTEKQWSGNAVISEIRVGTNSVDGIWELRFISATEFTVISPSGVAKNGFVNQQFSSTNGEISFLISSGNTAMVEGDNGIIITSKYLSSNIKLYDSEFPVQGRSLGTSVETIEIFGGIL